MPQTLLIFDFGANEEAVQQARHRLEGWRQAFHLGDRVQFKFERQPSAAEPAGNESSKAKKGKRGGKRKSADAPAQPAQESGGERLRLMVRLDFSNHEKLSYQNWLGRLGADPLLQGAEKQVLLRGQEGFDSAAETFDSLP